MATRTKSKEPDTTLPDAGGGAAPRPLPAAARAVLRRADGGAVPAGPAARRDLLRPGAGGHARRRRLRARAGRLAVPHAPRPHRAAREGPGPQARDGAVLGPDRRLHAGARRQQPHRRLARQPDLHRDVAPARSPTRSRAAPRSPTSAPATTASRWRSAATASTSNGRWHESLNFSAVFRLPVVWVVNNNQFAYSTPNRLEFPVPTIAERAAAYGMPGVRVDGGDVLAVVRGRARGRRPRPRRRGARR